MADPDDLDYKFVGREEFLKNLQYQWGRCRILGVFGLKSVGKSRTVEEFLRRLRSEHPNPKDVQHINVELQAVHSVQSFMLQVKAAFRDDGLEDDLQVLVEQLLMKMEEDQEKVCIINFDNAEDVIESPIKDMFVSVCEKLIGGCLGLRIVLTSTVKVKFPRCMSCYCQEELPLMSHSDGVSLMKSVTPSVDCGDVINQLVELCQGLPLAILMTGCELEMDSGFLSPGEMVDILTQSRLEAWSRDSTYSQQEQVGPVYRNHIHRLTDVFRQRLTVLGYIPGSFTVKYAQHMLNTESSSVTRIETLSPLMRRHMISSEPMKRRYNIHGILKDCLDVYFTVENLPEVRRRYCRLFSNVIEDLAVRINTVDCMDAIAELATEHPNLQKLLVDVTHSDQETYPVYIHMVVNASSFIEHYFGGESFAFYSHCLKLCELYRRPRDDAIVSGAYGRVLTNVKGDMKEGEEMYLRALKFASTDPSSEAMASQLYQSLGWNLHEQGKKEKALSNLKKAQFLQERLGMKYEAVVLTTLSVLGIVNTSIGNYEEGERCHMESLKLRREKHGENHPHIGAMYNNLGILYLNKGEVEKSNHYYRKGLAVKKATNATPSAIIISISNVVNGEVQAKNFSAAKQLLDEASEILSENPSISKLQQVLIDECYGRLYLASSDHKSAVRVFERTTHQRKIVMAGTVAHVENLLTLGRAYKLAGDVSKAMASFHEALQYKDELASSMPQNRFIWGCLGDMVNILMGSRSQGRDNSEANRITTDTSSQETQSRSSGVDYSQLLELFALGREELQRIIQHYTDENLFEMREKYDRKLREWNERCKKLSETPATVIYNRLEK